MKNTVRSVDEGAAGEGEEGQEEGRGGEGDGEAEHDLDQSAQTATHVAEGEAEARDDDDDDRRDLGDRALDRLQDALQRRLPRHAGARRLSRIDGREDDR